MTRRSLVALISASVIVAIVFVAALAVLLTTQTDFGRERIRRFAQGQLSSRLKGKAHVYVGRLSGSMLRDITVDSLSIYDDEDSLVLATGPVHVTFDPRDLIDQRLRFRSADISRPVIRLRRHADDVWNYRRIYLPSPKVKLKAPRSFGDYIVADSVLLHDGDLALTESWSPDDSLKGVRRDSAVRAAIKRPWPEVRMTSEGPKRTRRWTKLRIEAPFARIAHPDSVGQMIRLANLSAVENDPPVELRGLRGNVRIHGDTVWAALTHFAMPGSWGTANAHIWWGDNKPVRLDIHAIADSVSLSDFWWVYPNLPRTGGGRSEVYVRNDPKNLAALEFTLKNMDLRTTKSHLKGAMTFVTGWPVLVLKDVAVQLEPADFDLVRAFSGGYSAVDFQGQFTGRIHATGGRIDHWLVDSADLTYHDDHVPGAVTHLVVNGEIDLLYPSLAKFHGFDVDLSGLDLRTITYLFPSFPRVNGMVTGSVTLDSVWTDVRFSDADLEHHDGPDPPSHVTGLGRVTLTDAGTRLDLTLDAEPVSFSTLARSYPGLFARGTFSGPVRVKGMSDSLSLDTRLTGAAGTVVIDEVIDNDTVGGIGARGTVRGEALDVRRLTERDGAPVTSLFIGIANDVHGDSLASMRGRLDVTVDTSRVAGIWVPQGTARITVADGHLHFDSLTLTSTGIRARASGMLGLGAGARDTLRFTADIDSLGGLRSVIIPPDSGHGLAARVHQDSLDGTFGISGTLVGSVADAFTASATFLGERLVFGTTTAERVAGGFDIDGLAKAPSGSLWMRLDEARVAGVMLDTLHLLLAPAGADSGTFTAAITTSHAAGAAHGGALLGYAFAGDSTRFTLDTVSLELGRHRWRLAAPAHLVHGPARDSLDSIVVRAPGGALIAMRGTLPATGDVRAVLSADSVPLADVGALLQTTEPLGGLVTGDLRVTGTREAPLLRLGARFNGAKYGTLAFPYFTIDGDYAARKLSTRADFFDKGQAVATFALAVPADLAFQAVPERFPDEPITGRFTVDSLNLAVAASMSPHFTQPAGFAATDIAVTGTLRRPLFAGRLRVKNGEFGLPRFGLRLTAFDADVAFVPGGLRIDTLSMRSGPVAGNYMSINGTLRAPNLLDLLSDRRADTLDLTMKARNFQLIDTRRYASMEITDDVRLRGPFRALTLTGNIDIDKADFYLAQLSRKTTVIDLDDPELFQDSALLAARPPPAIPADVREASRNLSVEDLDVHIGDQVWLRSEASDIKLGGAVKISGSGTQRLLGTINVQRGTYRLDLGIVQRTFQVDSGTVSFYGDADRSGKLDIWASSTVRQANRLGEDVKIFAHVEGTTNAPLPSFSSDQSVKLSQQEILSYLIFGQPSPNDVTSANALSRTLAASIGPVMSSALQNQLKWVDQISIQTGNSTANVQQQSDAQSVLTGSRFGFGKQIASGTYVSANAGLCWIQGASQTNSFSQSLGVSVEQRLGTRFFLMASMEPSSAALLCKPGATDIGSRPQQFGLDLFREWSF